jgi:hypothetical protein
MDTPDPKKSNKHMELVKIAKDIAATPKGVFMGRVFGG